MLGSGAAAGDGHVEDHQRDTSRVAELEGMAHRLAALYLAEIVLVRVVLESDLGVFLGLF